ncbi:hypothetical protein QOZ80_3AG0216300 [Eleusine coracana subsp. coracana]|nr:hypothetical protein QOZ80_3AG0216300 [Eleusine coracana subsp. coracana]
MSQGQPRKPKLDSEEALDQPPIKYGDVFHVVSGELATQPVAPRDAALLQSTVQLVLGHTHRGAAVPARGTSGRARSPALRPSAPKGSDEKLPADRGATREDAERVTRPGGAAERGHRGSVGERDLQVRI